MINKTTMTILACLLATSLVFAQTNEPQSAQGFTNYLRSGDMPGLGIQSMSLLDPSRMTFSHSISSSYMMSGGEGVMQNLFMETIGYRISNPLSLTVNMGYLNQPYSTFQGGPGFQNEGAFVGSAALTWRPRPNMFLHLEVGNLPTYGSYGYPYGMYTPGFSPFNADQGNMYPRSSEINAEE